MARINLLPWREAQRRHRQRGFLLATGAALVAVLLVGLGVRVQLERMIAAQQSRNQLLEQEIAQLSQRIQVIERLAARKRDLLARMAVIQRLQASRPMVVHLFDELVTTLPDGVFLTAVSQRDDRVEVEGRARSNARVSAFMRNIDASRWIAGAKLLVIETEDQTGTGLSHFRLSFKQQPPDHDATQAERPGLRTSARTTAG
ncbi:PilN domain-containing protein [uncultured Thiohalocapsa sp.]|uniref:PilN domain-containing protein n=1 Tax=uncultured Thiohalocapsa sp. TaxID=768990 RepID=UPI0025E64DC2|nr:PilN domain-containing protein [uncultured Thiohalocapsa sp.]